MMVTIEHRIYVLSKKKNCIYILEISSENSKHFKNIGQFSPFTEKIEFIEKVTCLAPNKEKKTYFVAYGIDQSDGTKGTYLRFYDHEDLKEKSSNF